MRPQTLRRTEGHFRANFRHLKLVPVWRRAVWHQRVLYPTYISPILAAGGRKIHLSMAAHIALYMYICSSDEHIKGSYQPPACTVSSVSTVEEDMSLVRGQRLIGVTCHSTTHVAHPPEQTLPPQHQQGFGCGYPIPQLDSCEEGQPGSAVRQPSSQIISFVMRAHHILMHQCAWIQMTWPIFDFN